MDAQKPRTLQEFANELAFRIERNFVEKYGLDVATEVRPVTKTNIEKQGIIVRVEDSMVSPTVYADEAYQQYLSGGVSIPEVADKMCEGIYEAHKCRPEPPELTPEEAKKHVTLNLINTKKNRELLDNTPHFEILDGELSAIPRWNLNENASFVVSNDVCGQLGLTPDEILQIGQEHINSQHFETKSMQEILKELMGTDFTSMIPVVEGPPMIVVTSENRIQGSSALLSAETLDRVHDMIGDYCILPSSIHEIICVPISDRMDPDELREMVREVNFGTVAPEEQLSDQIFKHNGHKLTVVGQDFKMDAPDELAKIAGQKVCMAM